MISKPITIDGETYYPIERDNVYVGQEVYPISVHDRYISYENPPRKIVEIDEYSLIYETKSGYRFKATFGSKWINNYDIFKLYVKDTKIKYSPTQIGDLEDDL